jgi:hypothetical protein
MKRIMNTTTTETKMTESAQAAKAVRAALKVAFPGMKFAVRCENYSGGNAVRINWTNGPAVEAVEEIGRNFTAGSFNGMTDSYEYKAKADRTGPTAMYVTTSRSIDQALQTKVVEDLRAIFVAGANVDFETLAWRVLRKSDLRGGYAGVRSCDGFPGFEIIPAAEVA